MDRLLHHPSLQLLTLVLCVTTCNPIKLRDWENEVLERQSAVTKHPSQEKDTLSTLPGDFKDHLDSTTLTPLTPSRPDKERGEHVSDKHGVVRYGGKPLHGVVTHEANKARTKVAVVHYPGGRLLGPALHGPDWSVGSHPPVSSASSIEGTFLWAVGLLGTVQNAATVITVLSSRRCRRPLHILVGCLAITDLFISLIYIPSYTYFLLETLPESKDNGTKSSGENELWLICVILRTVFIQIASVTLSIKALIAGYLYMYTTSKQTAERVFTFQNTVVLILIAWFFNFLILFVPSIIGYEQVDFYPNEMLCYKSPATKPSTDVTLPFYVYLLSTLTLHTVELVVMCICFVRVHCAINKGRRIWMRKCEVEERPDAIMYNRATKTTILLFVSFTICWIPIYVINLLDPLHSRFPAYIHHISMDLLLLKSAINPGIYIYGIRSLRRELQIMCMCRCRDPNAQNLKFKAPLTSTFESDEDGEENDTSPRTMSPIKAV